MANQWFVVRNGKEQGPFTSQQLRTFASQGQLRPADDLRRDDMKVAVHAHTIKGLFPAAEVVSAPTATAPTPPAHGTITIFREPSSTGFMYGLGVSVDGTAKGRVGGGLLSGLMDVAMSRRHSITFELPAGEHVVDIAGGGLKRSSTILVEPGTTARFQAFFSNRGALGGGINFVAGNGGTILPANPTEAPAKKKRSLTKVAFATMGAMVVLFGAMRGCSQSTNTDIQMVKTGSLETHPGIAMGPLVNSFLGHAKWSSGTTSKGQRYVNVTGDMTFQGKKVRGLIQFLVTDDNFEFYAFEMNGIPQNDLMTAALIAKMYEEFQRSQ
ncbi:MAG: DUF4339 domain-containing protein [Planctomycetes bacterium]|nr:DUF4339 domain-containing protein [Planctomycetota bacterium]